MSITNYRISTALLCLFTTACVFGAENIYNVRDYGAQPDGKTLCTKSIQKAIDECARQGGGTVHLTPGIFLSGTIYMKSNVTLNLDSGCTLLGSANLKDYPQTVQAFRSYTDNYTDKSLVYGEKLQRIAITGGGIIDGRGGAFKGPYKVRPYMIRFIQCQNVLVKDVTIRNSPMWVQHYLACDDVRIDGITVRSHVNGNNDGIDIDSCHRVIISNCNVDSQDDAIVLKSTSARSCRNITISNCVLRSTCNALKMGTESNGGFENIVIAGCSIYDTTLAGIALEIVDGGTMDHVVVSNIAMNGVGAPIFLRLGNRARPFKKEMETPQTGVLRNVTISNIEATGANPTGCAISGLPGHAIENVTLSNFRLSFEGGGNKQDAIRAVPEKPTAYPEYSMFGTLPAYGLYCRHVKGLKLRNIQLQSAEPDLRHALVAEDAENISIDELDTPCRPDAGAIIRLTNVKGALIRGCRPPAGTDTFLKLEGTACEGVVLTANDFSRVDKITETAPDVPKTALSLSSNHTAGKQ
jgi:polygalacturonase